MSRTYAAIPDEAPSLEFTALLSVKFAILPKITTKIAKCEITKSHTRCFGNANALRSSSRRLPKYGVSTVSTIAL